MYFNYTLTDSAYFLEILEALISFPVLKIQNFPSNKKLFGNSEGVSPFGLVQGWNIFKIKQWKVLLLAGILRMFDEQYCIFWGKARTFLLWCFSTWTMKVIMKISIRVTSFYVTYNTR